MIRFCLVIPINEVYKRSVGIVAYVKLCDLKTFLLNKNKINFHQRNLEMVIVEACKMINGYAQAIINNLFIFQENSHFCSSYKNNKKRLYFI